MIRLLVLLPLIMMIGCSTAPNVCPMGDQTTACKCYRAEYTKSMCTNVGGGMYR